MRLLTVLFFGLSLAACGKVHIGDHDGGVIDPEDGGGGPTQCGMNACDEGEICCSESCGICGPAGEACPDIAECVDTCTSNGDCGPDRYCAWPDGACGPIEPGHVGYCEDLPVACPPVFAETCGCDGVTYTSPCDARGNGVSVAHDGACETTSCPAQDARSDSPECPAILGYGWDGARCRAIGGCSCDGSDCDSIFASATECEAAYSMCTSCLAQDAIGVGDCLLPLGTAWNGTECVNIGGCECAGADCDQLFESDEACEAGHSGCPDNPCMHTAGCAEVEYCHFAEGTCGGLGDCRPRPPELMCTFEAPPVCGCDGVTYGCEAQAYAAGTSVSYEGSCESSSCDPMDAEPNGPCGLVLGVRWNGMTCESFSGCSCVGDDCGGIYETLEDCERDYAGCTSTGRTCGTIAGLTCGMGEWCDYPTASWCGGDDEGGTCRPRPEDCTTEVDPVCACDGTIYSNACLAHRAGWDESGNRGACPMM